MKRLTIATVPALVAVILAGCGVAMSDDDGSYNQNGNNSYYADGGTTYECFSANECQPGQ